MLQPFVPFEKIHLKQLIDLGCIYIVTQTYHRVDHFKERKEVQLLLTDYKDLGPATMHYNAVRSDKYAAIINLKNRKHLAKIEEMMTGNKYDLFWGILKSSADLKKRLEASYKPKIRQFLMTKTSWRIATDEEVKTQFEVTFGELFLILKWRTQKLRIKFEEIEKI
ncbi:hypothetical protein FW778_16985 [Ginsengibacter hankyongi]|uniref:Uncharacterized protein n=1 Tax=Ginsengibacter hankyongi TaxID=2607284 RepID=A0A5J5IC73_9BACT|nr:hypothetical protein [Ginsengibacter hankyongi]KAA9037125.1 hypothetical protein FW778_16985 [Ginsengibacter hankyongi]